MPTVGSSVLFVVLSLIFFPAASPWLGGPDQGPPDLTRLSADERQMIASACRLDSQINSPAQYYYECIRSQLAALRSSPGKPDLSHLTTGDRERVTSACELDRQINGPAQYYDCLRNHLARLGVTSPVTELGDTPRNAQQRPTGIGSGPSSGTAALQKSEGLDPAIVATLCGSPFFVYLYQRFRRRRCSGCGFRTSNSTGICDSCRAGFESAEIRHREEQQQREREARAEPERHEEEAQRQAEYRREREAEARAQQQRRREEGTREKLRTLEDLQRLTGTDFERLVASLFTRDGYKVSWCDVSGDEGIDMVLEMGGSKDVVQCKRCKGDIGPPAIREFYRSMRQAGARRGFVIATASFTHSAKEFVDERPITLIDGHYLLAWISWADGRGTS